MSAERKEFDNIVPGFEQLSAHPLEVFYSVIDLFAYLEEQDGTKPQARGVGVFQRLGAPRAYAALNNATNDISQDGVTVSFTRSLKRRVPTVDIYLDESPYFLTAVHYKKGKRETIIYVIGDRSLEPVPVSGFLIKTLSDTTNEGLEKTLQKLRTSLENFMAGVKNYGADNNYLYYSADFNGVTKYFRVFQIDTDLVGAGFIDELPLHIQTQTSTDPLKIFNLGLDSIG